MLPFILKNISYNFNYRVNIYDCNGRIKDFYYTGKPSKGFEDFFEIKINISKNAELLYIFDLDGYICNIEMRDIGRKNSIMILKRNYNGAIYIFSKNFANYSQENLDYYLDYYNEYIEENKEIEQLLLSDLGEVLSFLIIKENNLMKNQIFRCINKLKKIQSINENPLYKTSVSVLPPTVRPDLDPQYLIIQIATGCPILEKRNKACSFCASFTTTPYYELTLSEIGKQIDGIKKDHPFLFKKVKKCFITDGDPIKHSKITDILDFINNKIGKVLIYESFISTDTILNISDETLLCLKQKGLSVVHWGVESCDDKTLQLLNKPHNLKMLLNAQKKLNNINLQYNIIIMCGVSPLFELHRNLEQITENNHVIQTVQFINQSECIGVFISKLKILHNTKLEQLKKEKKVFPFDDDEMELQYRSLIKKIRKNIFGSYGNQFIT